MSVKLSIYRNAIRDKTGISVSFDAVVQRIKDGKRGLDKKTKDCNLLYQTEPDTYKKLKETLPAVTWAGVFSQRGSQHLIQHSGFVVLDIDDTLDLGSVFADFANNPHVRFAFTSPSGCGVKPVIPVSPIPTTPEEHKAAFFAALEVFDEYVVRDPKMLPAQSNVDRLCFLAHDPRPLENPDAIPVEWDKEAWQVEQAEQEKHRAELESRDWSGYEKDLTALDFIPNDCDYETWRNVGMAIKAAGLSVSVFQKWTGGQRKRSTGDWVTEDINAHWGRYNSTGITWGTVIYLAMQNGYELPERKQAKRYQVDTEFQHQTSDLDTERADNKNVLLKWLQDTEGKKGKHLLILGSAAGTGKTTIGITTAEALLYIAQTTEEADQVFQTLWDTEDDVYRHRPRLFNRGHTDMEGNPDWETLPLGLGPNERPCIQPELCNLYAERGHPTHEICSRCPVAGECRDEGHLRQEAIEKVAMKVIYAWGEAMACDWIHRARIKRICPKDGILIVDEPNPANLTQKRQVTRDMLYDLTERFRDRHTHTEYETLKGLLDLISTADDETAFMGHLKAKINAIDDIEALDDRLQKYPVGHVFSKAENGINVEFMATLHYRGKEVTVPVVSHETAIDTPVFEVEPDREITLDTYQLAFLPLSVLVKVGLVPLNDPPRRFRSLLSDIKTFIDEHPNIETAPLSFDPKAQVFDFHLKPSLNHRRVIFNTASDPDHLVEEAYRDAAIQITRHTGTAPAWKDTRVFQLSTGNYLPRQSLLTRAETVLYPGDGEDTEVGALVLKPRAQEMVDRFIIPSLEAGLKTLIVAPKAFQAVESLKGWAVTDIEDFTPQHTAMLINHHHAEGRNDFQDCDIVFVFHYEPDHHAVQQIAKRIFRNAEAPVEFTREQLAVSVGSVSFEKNIYTDGRVQAVYNRECRQRLMQSAMRLRPNIHEGKIIVFLTAEPVEIPVTPLPFSLSDGNGFTGDWRAFGETLQAGDTRTAKERIAAGESKSKAYRDAPSTDTQKKDERDIEIVRRYARGDSKKQIATEMGIGQGTVKRVLDKQQF